MKVETPSDHAPYAGVGGVDCSSLDPLFDLSKTLGYSVDGPDLPEWLDLTYVTFDKSIAANNMEYSSAEYNDRLSSPGVTQRVFVRSQIPRNIVQEARESARRRQVGSIPGELLHIYIIVREDGLKLTWALERSSGGPPLKYGGYVPDDLQSHTVDWLKQGNSQYVRPDP